MRKPAEEVRDQIHSIVADNDAKDTPSEGVMLLVSTLKEWDEKLETIDSRGRLDGSKLSKHKVTKKRAAKKPAGRKAAKKATKKIR